MTGWLPPKLIPPGIWRVHKKGGDANDRLRNHYDFLRDNRTSDFVLRFVNRINFLS